MGIIEIFLIIAAISFVVIMNVWQRSLISKMTDEEKREHNIQNDIDRNTL